MNLNLVELENGDFIFVDKNGVTQTFTNKTAEIWKTTFDLIDFRDDFVPNVPQKIMAFLGDKKLVLTSNSLLKIVAKRRTAYKTTFVRHWKNLTWCLSTTKIWFLQKC